jgi:hypothetical protein
MSIQRIYRFYDTATPAELYAGRVWYPTARKRICAIVDKYGFLPYVTHETVAGIVAVLSPNVDWETNLYDAAQVVDSYPSVTVVSTYNKNRDKAYAILRGADTNDTSAQGNVPAGIVRGPKVVAFYENLRGDDTFLTLDSHAFNAWKGYRATGSKLPGMPAAERRQAVKDYTRAAEVKGETPAAFQAVIWLVWKRYKNKEART